MSTSHDGSPAHAADYLVVRAPSGTGATEMRYYGAERPQAAVAYVGGIGGGWDTPARGLYPRLATDLLVHRIAGLRVRFRNPGHLPDCVEDLERGVRFLGEAGVSRVGLVGHSAGGAVVVQVAAASARVRTVVTLASQSYGAEGVIDLAPRCSILLIHGMEDRVLPYRTSAFLYDIADEPKSLQLLPQAGHALDEQAERVYRLVHDWLLEELTSTARAVGRRPRADRAAAERGAAGGTETERQGPDGHSEPDGSEERRDLGRDLRGDDGRPA